MWTIVCWSSPAHEKACCNACDDVKKVIGLPGDVVSHQGMQVFVNGKQVATRLARTRLGITLTRGPEGPVPDNCFYVGTDHPRGFDSRYGEIGFVCRGQILGSGKAIL